MAFNNLYTKFVTSLGNKFPPGIVVLELFYKLFINKVFLPLLLTLKMEAQLLCFELFDKLKLKSTCNVKVFFLNW